MTTIMGIIENNIGNLNAHLNTKKLDVCKDLHLVPEFKGKI